MKRSFLTRIVYSNGLWTAGILMLLLSVFGNIFYFNYNQQVINVPAFENLYGRWIFGFQLDLIFQNPVVGFISRFLLLFGSALILQFFSSEYRLIRTRSFFPFFLFCVFSATILLLIPFNGSSFACFFFCWSCLRLFSEKENGSDIRAVFDASALLAIASLFQSKIIFIFPIFWMVMGIIQVFSFKSFFASIIGLISIFWIIFWGSFIFGDYTFLLNFAQDLTSFKFVDFSGFSSAEIVYTSFIGILMISAMLSFWSRLNLEKLRTRNFLNSLLLLWFGVLILWLFSGNNMGFMLFLFSLSALIIAHFFSLIDTFYSRSLFFIFIVLSVSMYFIFGT
jgi:hypothetical protein